MTNLKIRLQVVNYEVRDVTAKTGKSYTFKTALCILGGSAVKIESDVDMLQYLGKEVEVECKVSGDKFLKPVFRIVSVK